MYYFKNRKELLYDGELYINMKKKIWITHSGSRGGYVCGGYLTLHSLQQLFSKPLTSTQYLSEYSVLAVQTQPKTTLSYFPK